jgi:hypothetical protein
MLNEFWRRLCDTVQRTDYISLFADPRREILNIDDYTYSIDGNVLTTAGAVITATQAASFDLNMDSDSDFVLTYISGAARISGNTSLTLNPALLVQIKDQASGRNYFNTPAPLPLFAGQGGFPFLPTSPRVIRARSTLTVSAISAQVKSFSGFYLSLHGARIYYKGG